LSLGKKSSGDVVPSVVTPKHSQKLGSSLTRINLREAGIRMPTVPSSGVRWNMG
jgi:hypothetical protein